MLSYAERSEIIARNPTKGVRLPRVPLTHRPILDADEVECLAGALGPDHAPLMWLGLVFGLRWGEVAGLRAGRIDFVRSTVTVAGQMGRDRKTAAPKSDAGRRTLSRPHWLIAELDELLASRGPEGRQPGSLVFVTGNGEPWLYTSWRWSIWVPAVASAGLPGLRFHDLRSNAVYARATVEADRRAAEAVGRRFVSAIHARGGPSGRSCQAAVRLEHGP